LYLPNDIRRASDNSLNPINLRIPWITDHTIGFNATFYDKPKVESKLIGAYSATKHALEAISDALNNEL
jgi:hypothetical protein